MPKSQREPRSVSATIALVCWQACSSFLLGCWPCSSLGTLFSVTRLPLKYLGRLFVASVPAVISFIALGIALVGLWPRLSSLFWLYMGAGLIVQIFRGLFDLPKHAGNFTPFGWIANVPVENVDQNMANRDGC